MTCSHQFPEIIEAAQTLNASLIVDGEIVAFKDDQVLPFRSLQKRLGQKASISGPDRRSARCSHDL